jgi:hypothetical protein
MTAENLQQLQVAESQSESKKPHLLTEVVIGLGFPNHHIALTVVDIHQACNDN